DQAIVAFDPVTGGERWRWTLPEGGTLGGGIYYEYIQQVAAATDGDGVGVGRSTGSGAPALVDARVVTLGGATRQLRWLRRLNGDLDWALSYNAMSTVAIDAAGDVVVGGALQNSMPLLNLDFTVMKLAGSDGATLWRTTYPGKLDTDARESAQRVVIAPNS